MFDSVLGKAETAKTRFGVGTSVSVLLHAAIFAVALYLSGRVGNSAEILSEVKFISSRPAPPPPPPPPPGGAAQQQPKPEKPVEKKVVKKPDTIVTPKEIPVEKPPEAEPAPEPEPAAGPPEGQKDGQEGGQVGGQVGGQIGGQLGGQLGGQVGGQLGSDVLAFGEGMTRPVADARNRRIEYTREALEAHIEGTMLVRCVITVEGEVKNCRVVKPLPHMEKQVMDTIHSWRFTPVTYGGKPVSVDYVIPIRLVLPR
jgi:periplasmic protein TonB